MKILFCISSSGLFGAERVLLQIATTLKKSGNEVYVALLDTPNQGFSQLQHALEKADVCHFVVPVDGKFDSRSVAILADFIRSNKIQLLHTHNFKSNFIGFCAAHSARIPVIATVHGYITRGIKLAIYELVDKILLAAFNKVVVVSKSQLSRFCYIVGKVKVINNGIEVPENLVKSNALPYVKSLVIGTVGRLSKEKGYQNLIEAFARFVENRHDCRLLLVGDGELRVELEEQCRKLNISQKVTFTGFQENTSFYYREMDIYVSSSLVEHFPIAVMEAMSYGLPVIATDTGSTGELIIPNETGILIKKGSVDAILDALLVIVKNNDYARRYGENAREYCIKFCSSSRMVDNYKALYKEILNEHPVPCA